MEREAFKAAFALVGELVGGLRVLPRDVTVRREIGGGCSVNFFCAGDRRPVDEIAALLSRPVTHAPNTSDTGMFYEVRATVEGVSVCAWALLRPEDDHTGLRLGTGQTPPDTPDTPPDPNPGASPAVDPAAGVVSGEGQP
ncbi:hypothetical protein [Streptomyces sp. LNU-CPARS28]|uniref:hypothetical protein n=1 Tax=Streptomyces sp. LNU-CPARS28 TaxID=3137371 RepID=UPI003134829E